MELVDNKNVVSLTSKTEKINADTDAKAKYKEKFIEKIDTLVELPHIVIGLDDNEDFAGYHVMSNMHPDEQIVMLEKFKIYAIMAESMGNGSPQDD
jgi:hypothetical protein